LQQLFVAAGVLTGFGFRLPAQSVTLRADIPFEFHVGSKLMPAGPYTVSATPGQGYVRVDGDRDGSTGFFEVSRKEVMDAPGVSTLTFHRYGEKYFLATVQPGWSPFGYETIKTRTEKEALLSARVRRSYQIVARR
jgi:hypothetical protein